MTNAASVEQILTHPEAQVDRLASACLVVGLFLGFDG
jgi:hypothetical protein